MQVFVVVGTNNWMCNTSARAVFTSQQEAQRWVNDPKCN